MLKSLRTVWEKKKTDLASHFIKYGWEFCLFVGKTVSTLKGWKLVKPVRAEAKPDCLIACFSLDAVVGLLGGRPLNN